MANNEPTIGDLVMLCSRLIHQLRRYDPENPVAKKAMDYLRDKDCALSVLRELTQRKGDA